MKPPTCISNNFVFRCIKEVSDFIGNKIGDFVVIDSDEDGIFWGIICVLEFVLIFLSRYVEG